MSTIEWVNGRGEVRYQPVLADGRRLYHHEGELLWRIWEDPYSMRIRIAALRPTLYRSKKRAQGIAQRKDQKDHDWSMESEWKEKP